MIKKIKNIKFLLIWALGILIFSHAVVPHDHHYILETKGISDHNNHHNDSNKNQSVHCFAVNTLIFQKTEISTDKNSTVKILKSDKNFNLSSKFHKNSLIQIKPFIDKHFSLPEYIFSKIEPSRGSPSLFC